MPDLKIGDRVRRGDATEVGIVSMLDEDYVLVNFHRGTAILQHYLPAKSLVRVEEWDDVKFRDRLQTGDERRPEA